MDYREKIMYKILVNPKLLIFIIALFLMSGFIIKHYYNNSSNKQQSNIITAEGTAPIYETVESLEKGSDLIVKVTGTNKTVNHIEQDDEGLIKSFWTSRSVVINKVYSQVSDVKIRSEIIIYEPYAFYIDKNKKQQEVIMEGYYKINPEKEYILFLTKHKDGGYIALGGYQGKINFDDKEPTSNEKLEKLVKIKYNK
jgi:hypothetical protein